MNRSSTLYSLAFLAILGLALWYRLDDLGKRPLHGDEANQALKAWALYAGEGYRYDPHEHHGPTLYYGVLPIFKLFGDKEALDVTETQLRLLPVFFGMLSLLLIYPLWRALGRGAAIWAALLTAVSHAIVYYNRDFIQESLLVCFMLAAIVAGWRYMETRKLAWAVLTGVALGLMHATKETCVVIYAAMAGAMILTWPANTAENQQDQPARAPFRFVHIAALAGAAALVSVMLFSNFFTYWQGPLDSVGTYATYFRRAEGAGSAGVHDKPWYYYLLLLGYYYRDGVRWTEALVLVLALAGAVSILKGRPGAGSPRFLRFLAVFGLLLTVAYCAIPYKTPWNLLVFYQVLLLLAGVGAAALVRAGRKWPVQSLIIAALLAGTAHLGKQTYRGTHIFAADTRNPYVYSQTSTALLRLVELVDKLAAVHPDGRHMLIRVIREANDYWPLPWYLRGYGQVGYYSEIPEHPEAPVIIIGGGMEEQLETQLSEAYQTTMSSLRPGVLLLGNIEMELWEKFLASQE